MILYPQNLPAFPQSPPINVVSLLVNPNENLKFPTFNTSTTNNTKSYRKRLVIFRHVEKLGIINSMV